MDRHARTRALRVAAIVVVAGAAGLALIGLSDAVAVQIVGIVLLGGALVLAVSAIFYEVGASEDRDRAAEEAERERRRGGRP